MTALTPRAVDKLRGRARGWPPLSPGSVGSWLLLVTTKPPQWRDPLLAFPEQPLSAGHPHEGWFYPDPIGFWAECRRWATLMVRARRPAWASTEALAVSALVHLADEPDRLARRSRRVPATRRAVPRRAGVQARGSSLADVEQHQCPTPTATGRCTRALGARARRRASSARRRSTRACTACTERPTWTRFLRTRVQAD